jgi:hypothetical protein
LGKLVIVSYQYCWGPSGERGRVTEVRNPTRPLRITVRYWDLHDSHLHAVGLEVDREREVFAFAFFTPGLVEFFEWGNDLLWLVKFEQLCGMIYLGLDLQIY